MSSFTRRATPGGLLEVFDQAFDLEIRMESILEKHDLEVNRDKKRRLWKEYARLHAQRSPAIISCLEQIKGLGDEY